MTKTKSTSVNGLTTTVSTKKTITKPQRELKVRRSRYDYQTNQQCNLRTPIAEIQIKGKWLIEAGFDINAKVNVLVEHGKLVLVAE